MSFLGERRIVSLKHKKEVIRCTKKSGKKIKPVLSSSIVQITKQFADFVMMLPTDDNKKRRKPSFNKWAEQFQHFIDNSHYGYTTVQLILGWYVRHYQEFWRIESPASFIRYFKLILERYEKSINPYSSQQLKPIMLWLSRFEWKCSIEELEIVIGRSLWMVQRVLDKCFNKALFERYSLLCRVLINKIGNSFDFVQLYFEAWFWEHSKSKNIRIAEITSKKMFYKIRTWLEDYGIADTTIEQFIIMFGKLDSISLTTVM